MARAIRTRYASDPLPETIRSRTLAKPEWGTKRICPNCGTPFDPEAFLKARRARPAAPVEKELEPVSAEDIDPDVETEEIEPAEEGEEEEEEGVPLEEAEEEEEELIEDASELGEDEDDMAEVIDNVEEEEP